MDLSGQTALLFTNSDNLIQCSSHLLKFIHYPGVRWGGSLTRRPLCLHLSRDILDRIKSLLLRIGWRRRCVTGAERITVAYIECQFIVLLFPEKA